VSGARRPGSHVASVVVGNARFHYIPDGDPAAGDVVVQPDDIATGLCLTLKTEFLDQFNIIE
jgi:hypothetical protein